MTISRLKFLDTFGEEISVIFDEKVLPFALENFLKFGYKFLGIEILKETDLSTIKNF